MLACMKDLTELKLSLRKFTAERDWEQFHSPKNLVMALSVEASELVECFQWLDEAQSKALDKDQKQAVQEEIADVMCYLARLADTLDIDILDAVSQKMIKNAQKYPVEKAKGSARKYTEY